MLVAYGCCELRREGAVLCCGMGRRAVRQERAWPVAPRENGNPTGGYAWATAAVGPLLPADLPQKCHRPQICHRNATVAGYGSGFLPRLTE